MTPQTPIQTPYTMDPGYDKNSRPSKFKYFFRPSKDTLPEHTPGSMLLHFACFVKLSSHKILFVVNAVVIRICCPWKCWQNECRLCDAKQKKKHTHSIKNYVEFQKSRRNLRLLDWQSKEHHDLVINGNALKSLLMCKKWLGSFFASTHTHTRKLAVHWVFVRLWFHKKTQRNQIKIIKSIA